MFYKRDIQKALLRFAKFPVVAILGPRQAGKSTLARHAFKKYTFVSFDDLQILAYFKEDPKGFFKRYENEYGIIIDEFQNAPELLSYIKVIVDEKHRPGYFVLTGSQNYLMNPAITQSLAGRVGILTLLPLSINEMISNKLVKSLDETIFNGAYPRLYADKFSPLDAYPSYIHTYIERDVRQLTKVGDIRVFQKFMALCAGRVGQQLNIEDIATNCGVERKIINQWLSVLEASYIIFLLCPYFKNFNKRITKTPKLYFYDTGLACSLLGLRSSKDIAHSPFRGSLFECLIISDFYKQYYNIGRRPPLYYWRDQNGRIEIDCLIDKGISLIPIEIKSGQTIVSDYFDTIKKWNELTESTSSSSYIVYAGSLVQNRSLAAVLGWEAAGDLIKKI